MTDIINILKSLGYSTVPASFYGEIAVWKSWYDGNVRSFHSYQVYNGLQHVSCKRYTMGMAKKVAEDWANLLLNEKVKITLEGTAEQEFFDEVCKDNNFAVKSNEMQELKSAVGTAAYVVRASGVSGSRSRKEADMDYKELIEAMRSTDVKTVFSRSIDAADAIETLLEERDAAVEDLRGQCSKRNGGQGVVEKHLDLRSSTGRTPN